MPATLAFIPIGVDPPSPQSDANPERTVSSDAISLASIVHQLRELSIDMDRTTCPRMIEQFLQSANRPIDTVLCNALDADPTARPNASVIAAFPNDVSLGVKLVARAANAERSRIVVDSAVPRPSLHGRRGGDDPKLVAIDAAYPQMNASLLLPLLFKRALAARRLPVERGVIMLDAVAAFVIARLAVGSVSVALPIVIRDHRSGETVMAMVAPEIPLGEILSTAKVQLDQRSIAIVGETLRKRPADLQQRAGSLDPTIHLCPAEPLAAAEPCVRCNWCADVCPTGMLPMFVLEAAQSADRAAADRAGVRRCIDCGLCDYVCPSRLPLTSAIARFGADLSAGPISG